MMGLTLRDFDAEQDRMRNGASSTGEPAEPVYTFTESELAKLLSDARQAAGEAALAQGIEEGQRMALDAEEKLRCAALAAIKTQISDIHQRDAQHRAELEQDLIDMVLDIAERVVPELLQHYSHPLVHAKLAEALHIGGRQAQITVRLCPETKAALERPLAELARSENIQAPNFLEDDSLARGEARVSWENGFLSYSLDRVCDGVLSALRSASAQMQNENQKV
ncbi:FliH/SctL family protein [Cognatishimia sp. SS12]|uniref:FliH/SctL family protein n=1 Tax=Cognatishimia sp. SS12 TaxID=2979465 RepID=UPI00232AEBAC|nr:FliH/SctL family protein [Cognatishimia sp. SS12]MDC0739419.1 FliH/SctL family protein [Cognatishimia sp. SS12]